MKLIVGGLPLPILDALAYALCGAIGFEALLDADVPPTINVVRSGGEQLADEYDQIMASRGRSMRAIRVGGEVATPTTARVRYPDAPPAVILDALANALCGAASFEELVLAGVPIDGVPPTINVGESGGKELADAYDAALITIPTTRSWCRRAIRVGSEASGAIHEAPPAPVPVPIPAAHGRLRPAGEPAAFIGAQLRAAHARLADAVAVLGTRWGAGDEIDHALDVLAAAQADLESVVGDMRRIRREAEYLETQGRG